MPDDLHDKRGINYLLLNLEIFHVPVGSSEQFVFVLNYFPIQ